MFSHNVHHFPCRLTWPNFQQLVITIFHSCCFRVEVLGFLKRSTYVFYLIHEHLDPFVQPSGDARIEHLLKSFLLLHSRIKKVVLGGKLLRNNFLFEENIKHLLNKITYVDQLQKGDEWLDFCRVMLLYLARIVVGQMLDGSIKTRLNVSGPQTLKQSDENKLAV